MREIKLTRGLSVIVDDENYDKLMQYIHLGTFSVQGDADSAYRIAEEKYFGEFARNDK